MERESTEQNCLDKSPKEQGSSIWIWQQHKNTRKPFDEDESHPNKLLSIVGGKKNPENQSVFDGFPESTDSRPQWCSAKVKSKISGVWIKEHGAPHCGRRWFVTSGVSQPVGKMIKKRHENTG